MDAIVLSGPAVEPVTLADAKAYLRLDGADEDDLVGALVASARLTIEAAAHLAMVDQTWRFRVPAQPGTRQVACPVAPLRAVTAVRILRGGETLTPAPSDVTMLPGCDRPALGLAAGVDLAAGDVVEVEAVFGFGPAAADVPPPLRLAIRHLVARWFESRGDGPDHAAALPVAVRALVAPFERRRLA